MTATTSQQPTGPTYRLPSTGDPKLAFGERIEATKSSNGITNKRNNSRLNK